MERNNWPNEFRLFVDRNGNKSAWEGFLARLVTDLDHYIAGRGDKEAIEKKLSHLARTLEAENFWEDEQLKTKFSSEEFFITYFFPNPEDRIGRKTDEIPIMVYKLSKFLGSANLYEEGLPKIRDIRTKVLSLASGIQKYAAVSIEKMFSPY